MTDTPPLLTHIDNGILIATLNRPEKLNAMNRGMVLLIDEAVAQFRDTPELKVMLIRSTRGRYFCSGADLKDPTVERKPCQRRPQPCARCTAVA